MDHNRLQPRVLVSHHAAIIRIGLVAALQRTDLRDRVEACAPDDANLASQIEAATVVVTDYEHALQLCDTSAINSGSRFRAADVVVVSDRDAEEDVRKAIDAGVRGYFLVNCAVDEFLDGIRIVCRGTRHLSTAAANRMVDSLSRERLTARELQVLRCLVNGSVNKQIVAELSIAMGTVKAHLKAIFGKLNVTTRTQAVSVATTRGLASPPLARTQRPKLINTGQARAGLSGVNTTSGLNPSTLERISFNPRGREVTSEIH